MTLHMEQIIFENNRHSSYLYHPELSDGRLHTKDGHSFDIHKVILARSSEYFCALFCRTGRQDVSIPGIKGDILSSILTYVYKSYLHITQENFSDLLLAADYLLLSELVMDIRRQLSGHLSVSNCLSLFEVAKKLNYSEILRWILLFILLHFEEIVQSDDSKFSELRPETLKELLSDMNLSVGSENTIWLAIVKWVKADACNRLSHVPDLLVHLINRDVDEQLAFRMLEHSIVVDNRFCNEITQMKLSNSFSSNLRILYHYCLIHSQPTLHLYKHRHPSHLNFIVCHFKLADCYHYDMYITYDEDTDLWQKIGDFDSDSESPNILIASKSNIFSFEPETNEIHRYSLDERRWFQIPNFAFRRDYSVVKIERLIYLLGGRTLGNGEVTFAVTAFDPERIVWNEVAPMIPVSPVIRAVTLGKCIYVIGETNVKDLDFDMMVQVYDPQSDIWSLLPSPVIPRCGYAVIVYREKLFVIGGENLDPQTLISVEVFDPVTHEWAEWRDLPYEIGCPEAIVLFDNLIVFGDDEYERQPNPPVYWNERLESWTPIEPASPLNELIKYKFFTLEYSETNNILTRESSYFMKSPFS